MPTFCYSNKVGKVLELNFAAGKAPSRVRHNGLWFYRDIAAEHNGFKRAAPKWPILSESMGCHPSQVEQFTKHYQEIGVPTEFTKDGQAVFRDRAHRRAALKATGHIDRDSFTGY